MSEDRAALGVLLRPIRGRLWLATAVQAVATAVGVVPFVAVAELGRTLLADGPVDHDRAWAVTWVAAGAVLVRLVLLAAAGGVSHFADNQLQLDIRRRILAHLGRVPLGWFSEGNSGGVKKAVQEDVATMHHLVAHSRLEITAAAVGPLVTLGYLFWVDWRMALITLAPLVVGLCFYARNLGAVGAQLGEFDQAMGAISASTVEFVDGISVVKIFGRARGAHDRFLAAADDYATFFRGWVTSTIGLRATSEILLSPVVALLVVLTGGGLLVTRADLPGVDLLPFALLGTGLSAPILALSYGIYNMRIAHQAAANVRGVLAVPPLPLAATATPPAAAAAAAAAAAGAVGDEIVLDGVRFSYDGRTEVLRGIDLTLAPGTITALVGASGSGKSTLASLVPRFDDVTDGALRLGGVDVRELRPEELYRRVAFVFQDTHLLRASIGDNIRLARPDADLATVRAVARAARVDERIRALPRGYDSVVGEDAQLSGGEAQRVAIARALLADTPVIVLDEATVFTDPEAEADIQDALSELTRDRTVLVIAHRLATIVGADQIVVLADGRIAERGTHGELVAAGGRYAHMWAAHEQAADSQPIPEQPIPEQPIPEQHGPEQPIPEQHGPEQSGHDQPGLPTGTEQRR
ncbi:ABC transporter ATP-binding protein/permease [Frankia sp. Ag45/Mut15]|uniref:ABC transporter ATP-binding protein/permease n=1 Tax=Frankia umida TaxID=573489 RepID=A0ABT0JSS6_9ACTN|nr:ABC transporter ATP-binding protein [Frankia umida]MCK9874257.1 ABC transporter ATP-binding protein/permease [Frankia umida]